MIQSRLFLQFKELNHFFLGKRDDQKEKYVNDLIAKSIFAEQVHGNKIAFVKKKSRQVLGADGLLTNKNIFLTIRTADCLPIFFYDPKNRLVGAVHAGWKGLFRRIINNTVTLMNKFGSKKENIRVAIGPHIKACCYQVPYERILKFKKNHSSGTIKENLKWFLDMEKIAISQLRLMGILEKNIDVIPICSSCDKGFYSFRRDGISSGRMLNTIGLI